MKTTAADYFKETPTTGDTSHIKRKLTTGDYIPKYFLLPAHPTKRKAQNEIP